MHVAPRARVASVLGPGPPCPWAGTTSFSSGAQFSHDTLRSLELESAQLLGLLSSSWPCPAFPRVVQGLALSWRPEDRGWVRYMQNILYQGFPLPTPWLRASVAPCHTGTEAQG